MFASHRLLLLCCCCVIQPLTLNFSPTTKKENNEKVTLCCLCSALTDGSFQTLIPGAAWNWSQNKVLEISLNQQRTKSQKWIIWVVGLSANGYWCQQENKLLLLCSSKTHEPRFSFRGLKCALETPCTISESFHYLSGCCVVLCAIWVDKHELHKSLSPDWNYIDVRLV